MGSGEWEKLEGGKKRRRKERKRKESLGKDEGRKSGEGGGN